MARFRGKVGFYIETDDQDTGISKKTTVEKTFYGRVIEHTRRLPATDNGARDLTLSNQIAITATDYAFKNATAIVYVEYLGSRWEVTSMRVHYPEITLTLGGVYNGPVQNRTAE